MPKPIWEPKLTITIEARFSTGERAGSHSYLLTREQLQELAASAKAMEIRPRPSGKLQEYQEAIDDLNERLQLSVGDRFDLPPAAIPEPELDPNLPRLAPLISTEWSWVEQTRSMMESKKYDLPAYFKNQND